MTMDGEQQPADFWARVTNLASNSNGPPASSTARRKDEKSTDDFWSRVQQLADSASQSPAISTSNQVEHAKLISVAERRMPGFEHQVIEDVVSHALVRWRRVPPNRQTPAHLVQLVKSETYSFLRREQRARGRTTERHASVRGTSKLQIDRDATGLRDELAQLAREAGARITPRDVQVLELLLAGFTLPEIARRTELTNHQLRMSRRLWMDVLRSRLQQP